ncbi:MAG: LON peptidase substrate-binding domain-containing protein [Candidatus Omnitrophota bacterium]
MIDLINLKNFSGMLPLFPLPNVVHFPHTLLPLHIFEKRYRIMLRDALKGEKLIGMSILKPGWEEKYEGNPEIYPIACLGAISKHEPMNDGRSNILLLGIKRVRIKDIITPRPYRTASVEILEDKKDDLSPLEIKQLRRHLYQLYSDVVVEYAGSNQEFPTLSTLNLKLGSLTDVMASFLSLPVPDLVRLLEEIRIGARAEFLIKRMESMLQKGGPTVADISPSPDYPSISLN